MGIQTVVYKTWKYAGRASAGIGQVKSATNAWTVAYGPHTEAGKNTVDDLLSYVTRKVRFIDFTFIYRIGDMMRGGSRQAL